MFDPKGINKEGIPLPNYVKLDIELLGFKVPRYRFLITQSLFDVLDPQHSTKLPEILGGTWLNWQLRIPKENNAPCVKILIA